MTVGSGRTWRPRLVTGALIASAVALGSGHAGAQDQLKVAAVFETPIEEPWVNQIHVALLQAKKELGIEYTWSESVSASDFARVLSGYAEQDHGLIMGDAFGTEKITRRVAETMADTSEATKFSPSPRPTSSGQPIRAQTSRSGSLRSSTASA